MRGFLVGALVLAGLDLALQSPAARVATALALPARWLAEWTDPSVPLIPDKSGASTTASGSSPTSATLL